MVMSKLRTSCEPHALRSTTNKGKIPSINVFDTCRRMIITNMLQYINVEAWTPSMVLEWLKGLCDDSSWLNSELAVEKNINGKRLMLITPELLEELGATRINLQEYIFESIEKLKFYNFNLTKETLQTRILQLACEARSLQRQLFSIRSLSVTPKSDRKSTLLTPDFKRDSQIVPTKQRVSIDTLSGVSNIVKTVKHVVDMLNCPPFSQYDDYRSMKSLLIALSIELTSTAQRDQFVDRPNDIIEKSSKALADYCDRIVMATKDPLLIQPFVLESVRIRKNPNENDLGLKIRSSTTNHVHVIEKILPLSPAKKTNKLNVGDEILQFNQYIVGWSPANVEKLLNSVHQMNDVVMVVKKHPGE